MPIQRAKWLGWRPDLPDARDLTYAAPLSKAAPLPPILSLRDKMPPVYDQGALGCHDERTEVLTDSGWKPWTDISGTELLGTMQPETGDLEFQAPSALHAFDYNGPVFRAEHKSLDFALTPNHRMFVRPWDEKARTLASGYRFTQIDNIGWYAGLPVATSGHQGITLKSLAIGNRDWCGDDFLALVALVVSDGWVGGTEANRNVVSFCCFRDDRQLLVRGFTQRLGIPEVPGRPGVWKWTDAALAAWFRANAYTFGERLASPFKRIPGIIKTVSSDQIGSFLRFFGDQHIGDDGSRQFYTASEGLAGDIQELLLRVGKRASLYERAPRSTIMADGRHIDAENCTADITITERRSSHLSIERKRNLRQEDYKGPVYCATVPNSLLVTRRNGSILISGNSCTSNAIGAAVQYARRSQKLLPDFVPSRLFNYYCERLIERTVYYDAGAMIRDGMRVVAKQGSPPETDWPYDISKFAVRPPKLAYLDALHNQVLQYSRVTQSLSQMKGCLAAGFPFVLGFAVYASFMTDEVATTGIMPMPASNEDMLGGHAVLCVGYDDTKSTFLIRNSWSEQWGQAGYFEMPYAYLIDRQLSSDLWMVRLVES